MALYPPCEATAFFFHSPAQP